MEGLMKLMEDPIHTLYSVGFLIAFLAIVYKYFIKGGDDDD